MFCRQCGTKINKNDNYCFNCGTKTEDSNNISSKTDRMFIQEDELCCPNCGHVHDYPPLRTNSGLFDNNIHLCSICGKFYFKLN